MLQDVVKNHSKRGDHPAPMVMSDIKPYRNVLDGKEISSRSAHREFLARNNLVEVGNEPLKTMAPKLPSKGEIAAEVKETIEQLRAGYVNPDDGVLPTGDAGLKVEPIAGEIKNGDYIRSDVLPDE
jgi:hypothetical protein